MEVRWSLKISGNSLRFDLRKSVVQFLPISIFIFYHFIVQCASFFIVRPKQRLSEQGALSGQRSSGRKSQRHFSQPQALILLIVPACTQSTRTLMSFGFPVMIFPDRIGCHNFPFIDKFSLSLIDFDFKGIKKCIQFFCRFLCPIGPAI